MTTISEADIEAARGLIREENDQLLGLLDFYSDRATAHASLSVAVIFGIFGLLGIHRLKFEFSVANISFVIVYGVLWLAAIYLVLNFGWYTQMADSVIGLISKREIEVKLFTAYRKRQPEKTINDFFKGLLEAEWLYEPSRCKWFHRRYLALKSFLVGSIRVRRLIESLGGKTIESEYLTRETWAELLRISGVVITRKYKKSFLICLVLILIAILIAIIEIFE